MAPTLALAAAADEEHGGFWATAFPIIPHPGELIFGIVAFVILYVVVAKKVVPRLEAVYAERTAAIEGGMHKAEEAQAEAQRALEEYRAQLANAQGEAGKIRQEAREQAASIIAEARSEAVTQAERIVDSGSRQLEAERQQAYTQLRGEVGRLAIDLASRIVGESLEEEARQRRTVDRFLESLDQADTASAGRHQSAAPTGRP